MTPDVLVLGNTVVDVLVRGVLPAGPAAAAWADNVALVDHPIIATLGGCGAGPAHVLGSLGARVALITNLGIDAWGKLAQGWLETAGVVRASPALRATAVHIVALDPAGRRRSLYFTGGPVPWSLALQADTPAWVVGAGYGGVRAEDLAALGEVFRFQRQHGARVLFDPGPWFAGRVERACMVAVWEQVDCLVGTEDELGFWLGEKEPAAQITAGLDCGPAMVVVKRGRQGAAGGTRDGWRESFAADCVPGGNSVGAGDAFNGRLAWGLASGEAAPHAVAASVRLATQVVRHGAGVLGVAPPA